MRCPVQVTDFEEELDVFRNEEETAQQYFFAYLSVKSLAASDGDVLANMNSTPLFWRTTHHAMVLAAFVAVGRIFDQDQKSDHNVDKLMRVTGDSLSLFTKPALAARNVAAGLTQQEADAYVDSAYELTWSDVRDLKKRVAHWRRIYEDRYRDVRHLVFAHRASRRCWRRRISTKSRSCLDSLPASTQHSTSSSSTAASQSSVSANLCCHPSMARRLCRPESASTPRGMRCCGWSRRLTAKSYATTMAYFLNLCPETVRRIAHAMRRRRKPWLACAVQVRPAFRSWADSYCRSPLRWPQHRRGNPEPGATREGLMDAYKIGDSWQCAGCAKGANLTTFAGAEGPYRDGGGLGDNPRHCASCGVFLRNPLAPLGLAYVRGPAAEWKDRVAFVAEWLEFYGPGESL
jgi:hypothetical protein